ncbi:MAG: ABC transporter ATP-binding protein [Anaerolineae bacterium]|nr:ABC transporter ATP-binding protein [Anaerolineae bacterium]
MPEPSSNSSNPSSPAPPSLGTESRSLRPLWRCYAYLRYFARWLVGAYTATLLINGLNILVPQVIRWIIDVGIREQRVATIAWAVLGLLGLTLVKGGLTFVEGRWIEQAAQGVAYELRARIQAQLTRLSFAFHAQTETGELLSRAIQDVERIRVLTGRATNRIVNSAVLLVATAGAIVWMNRSLALVALAAMPLLLLVGLRYGQLARPLALRIQQAVANLTTRLDQNLRGVRVVKAFAQEAAEIGRFEAENERWFSLVQLNTRQQAVYVPLLNLVANLASVAILWLGGRLVIQGQLTLGELVAFITYLGQLVQPVRVLGNMIPQFVMGSASAARVLAILDAVPDVRDAPDAYPLPPIEGRVRLEHVSFGYGEGRPILQDIDVEAQPGEVVALLGPTGSGKSTLVNLIPRFYDPTAGRVLVDGHDIRGVTLTSLREQIGLVLQETTLFARTIRENIAFGQPDATDEDVIAAAKAAQAHDFITQMPNGYDTAVGERGVTLSGGQKQRLAIARALLTQPRILILDDATASVDTATESLIRQALDRQLRCTTFIIAHRLSTCASADLILMLDAGRIVARGTHADLLRASSLYADLWRRQTELGQAA